MKPFSQIWTVIVGLIVFAAVGSVQAQSGALRWMKDSVTARVVDVMPDSGMIVMEDAKGRQWQVLVDRSVDLNALQKGETVSAVLFRAQALSVSEPTEADRQNPVTVERTIKAPPGISPLAGNLSQIRALVKIVEVDRAQRTITVQQPGGRSVSLAVLNPRLLNRVKEGEEWVVSFTRGIAASIRKQE